MVLCVHLILRKKMPLVFNRGIFIFRFKAQIPLKFLQPKVHDIRLDYLAARLRERPRPNKPKPININEDGSGTEVVDTLST